MTLFPIKYIVCWWQWNGSGGPYWASLVKPLDKVLSKITPQQGKIWTADWQS